MKKKGTWVGKLEISWLDLHPELQKKMLKIDHISAVIEILIICSRRCKYLSLN